MWAIRGMPEAERTAALASAARADMNIGEWLAEAVRLKLSHERGEMTPQVSNNMSDPVQAAAAMAWATAQATQRPLPRSVSRLIYKHVMARIENQPLSNNLLNGESYVASKRTDR